MFTSGIIHVDKTAYKAFLEHTKKKCELLLIDKNNQVVSAYKQDKSGEYSFNTTKAKEACKLIQLGYKGCTAKNGNPVPFERGAAIRHEFTKSKVDYVVDRFNDEICNAKMSRGSIDVELYYHEGASLIPDGIQYVKLAQTEMKVGSSEDNIVVRSVREIMLEKEDLTWLKNKKYYIVNDESTAEKIFSAIESSDVPVAYDVETTGLKINMFGKIGSSRKEELKKWNQENPDDQIRADELVGIILCVEENVSYYFPCKNRKFKNLYEERNEETLRTIRNIKAKYTVGELRDSDGDMARYVRNTPVEEFTPDVVLMERVRKILETKHIVAHNGAFEWKSSWLYEIDINLKDDTMIMHQIMHKFRSTTNNRGESSSLKHLAKVELGMDQWELGDFFPNFKEDKKGEVRGKKAVIDFSYMDYDGTRIYAPTDGDATLQIFHKYRKDIKGPYKEMEYLYNVEVIVAVAIGYMEFYGHRIDEKKIAEVREDTLAKMVILEYEIRDILRYTTEEQRSTFNKLKELMGEYKSAEEEKKEEILKGISDNSGELKGLIDGDQANILNLASPAQVATLFFDTLKIPFTGEKKSVGKKIIKGYLKMKDEDGNPKYPIINKYSEYKNLDTLLTKFFGNLPNFMYPGGYIFSSYGQISTATGRMSCSKPNAQQYPKVVTNIVIPREGCVMVDADYSQIEYRVLVALAGEKKLAELFSDPDNDYHTLMASLMYGVPYASVNPKMRGDAKSFNFGIPYGMGFKSLAILLTGMSGPAQVEEAKEKYELYFKDQPNVRKFFDKVKEMAEVNKYTKTFWNRYRYYSFMSKDGTINNALRASALRQAGNAVIQGSAADIFKISVARNIMYIRKNKLFGKMFIINMVHDEQLYEIDVTQLNIDRVLRDIGINMQFKVEGYPPLFIGAGVEGTWSKAKGKMAEIHPYLLEELSREADNTQVYADVPRDPKEVVQYYRDRIDEFRERTVMKYVMNPENYGNDIHPAVGNLLNLQFTYGHDKDKEGLSNNEFTLLCLEEFIKHHNLDISIDNFKVDTLEIEEEEDEDGYDDGDEEALDDVEGYVIETDFALLDEKDIKYGVSLHELINTFGYLVSRELRVCGIDTRNMAARQIDSIADMIQEYAVEDETEGALEVVLLRDGNILFRTGVFVKGITGSLFEKRLKMREKREFDGTVNERLSG